MRQKDKGSEVIGPPKSDVMEKTPAACSLEWSIELEKGLRSKIPSKRVDAISHVVAKLKWWNRQCSISGAEYKIFGLVPSEDKLFLNAILLRLADAFRTGDKHTKRCIVKSFMPAQNSATKEMKEELLFKHKLDNSSEVLGRVKMVFDDGDVEDRALALYLLGCWAEFAKDHAAIRYCILSSSVSNDVLEVKASFFAAGCFSALADDFARTFLNILANRLDSVDSSPVIKLSGCRVLSKMQCSYSLANRAYETGSKLLLDSSHQEFSIGMLISLTKIATRWTMLIAAHVELLSRFLVKEDAALGVQVTTLKCIQCVLASGVCPSLAATGIVPDMVNAVRRSKYSSALLGKALKVMHVIVCYYYLPTFHASEMLDVLAMLFEFIKDQFKSSSVSERIFSVWILLDIVGKFMGGRGRLESSTAAHNRAQQVITFVMDDISALLDACDGKHQLSEETEQEVRHLLELLLNLVENHSDVCGLVLHRIPSLMKHLANVLGDVSSEKEGSMDCDISECGTKDKRRDYLSFLSLLAKMMNICLDKLQEDYDTYHEVLDPVKLLVDSIIPSVSLQLDTRSAYMFLLHYRGAYLCMWKEAKRDGSCKDSITQYDSLTVEYAKKLCEKRDYWTFYKAGKLAACHGSWSTAIFIFEQLLKLDLSDFNKLWFQSCLLFSRSERQLELFGYFPTEDSFSTASVFNWNHFANALNEAISGLHAAERALDTSILEPSTRFQKWFLVLRAKFLQIMKDTNSLLASLSSPSQTSERLSSLAQSLSQVSCKLNKIANEYDLLAISFAGMDRNSTACISALAASCSLLAFSTDFALSVPHLHEDGSEAEFHVMLTQDLLHRLCLSESEARKSLFMLSKIYKTQSQHTPLSICCRERGFVKASRYAVEQITNPTNRKKVDVFKLMSELIFTGMLIHSPLRCPSFYFKVGNCVQSELFFMDENGKTLEGKSILAGRPLLLNVCIQVKNMPAGMLARVAKLHCILSCRIQSGSESDGILELNGKLARHVISGSSNNNNGRDSGIVEEYLHFVPNERGQGILSCLLDVSGFPVGGYRIRWQGGFVDDESSYRSLLPLNDGPSFIVADTSSVTR